MTTKFAASMVFKEYKTQTLADIDFTALAAMPALVEDSLSYAEAERLVSVAAWPCALVEDTARSTGFVMPAIPEEFFIPLTTVKGVSKITAEFQHLLNHSSVVAARGIDIDDAQRYSLLREVASGLAFLHKHGVCVGDISPKNLLFSLTPDAAVYFIDCDAMRVNGVSALRQVETPGWGVPAGEEFATVYSDTYKLGLLALRLLAGDHDVKNPHRLPATTPDLLRQIITDALTKQPHGRPLPEAWSYVLGHAIEIAQHHHKTAAATPASAVPEITGVPVVHSTRSAPPSDSRSKLPQPIPRARPVERPPAELIEETPQRNRQSNGMGLAILVVAIVVILADVASRVQPLAALAHIPNRNATLLAPAQGARSTPFRRSRRYPHRPRTHPRTVVHYVKTPWGTRCQVSTDQIIAILVSPDSVGYACRGRMSRSEPE